MKQDEVKEEGWRPIAQALIPPFARNIVRVFSGFMIGAGYFSEDTASAMSDDAVMIVGFLLWSAVEAVYLMAKKKGWAV